MSKSDRVRTKLSVVFNPMSLDTDKCIIARLHSLINEIVLSGVSILIINKWFENIKSFLSSNSCSSHSKNIFISHTLDFNLGFLTIDNKMLNDTWWNLRKPYSLGYIHACNGARVINGTKLKKVYSQWVSYDDDLPASLGIDQVDECWKEIFKSFIKVTLSAENSTTLLAEMSDIYDGYIKELAFSNHFFGKSVLISELGQAFDSLEKNL